MNRVACGHNVNHVANKNPLMVNSSPDKVKVRTACERQAPFGYYAGTMIKIISADEIPSVGRRTQSLVNLRLKKRKLDEKL